MKEAKTTEQKFSADALSYAKELGGDSIEYCGEKDGYCYFLLRNSEITGKYTGMPITVKYNVSTGKRTDVETSDEIQMAFHLRYEL